MQLAKLPTKRQQEVLLRVLKYIKQEPDRLDMYAWGKFHPEKGADYPKEPTSFCAYTWHNRNVKQPIPPCKTTGCLAGTVLLVTKKGQQQLKYTLEGVSKDRTWEISFPGSTDDIAAGILKLTEKQTGDLFYFKSWGHHKDIPNGKMNVWGQPDTDGILVGWPKEFETLYHKAKTGKERYKVLEARVKYFFKKGL